MAGVHLTPRWTTQPPVPGSYRSLAKLGRPDQLKVPSERFLARLKRDLGVGDDYFADRCDGNRPLGPVPPPALAPEIIERLAAIAGPENVQTGDYERVRYSHGKLAEETVNLKHGVIHEVSDAVVHPRTKAEVRELVGLCDERRIPLYAYGGGSSCNMGFAPQQGGITIVLSTHLNRVLEVNEENHTARVQAGCMGPDLEAALNGAPERFGTEHRFTNGHFPQSFELSSVGGWVLALGSGQASTYYGEPANLVLAMEMVTPAGTIVTHDFQSTATGPKVLDMLKGSEGTFGILVELTIRVFRHMPQNRRHFAYLFKDWEQGVRATREVTQGQFGLPAVFRLSDPRETDHAFELFPPPGGARWALEKLGYRSGRRSLCIGTVEGDAGYTRLVRRKIARIARSHGGLTLTGKPARDWERDRYETFLLGESVSDYRVVMDTVETPVNWDGLHRVRKAVLAYADAVPGTACMCHMSHFYASGTNLYFIFAVRGSVDEYVGFRTGLVDAMVAAGGSPSHHHGVGRLMHPWMEGFLGTESMGVLRALKRHLDPNGVMNPGYQLGLDVPGELRR